MNLRNDHLLLFRVTCNRQPVWILCSNYTISLTTFEGAARLKHTPSAQSTKPPCLKREHQDERSVTWQNNWIFGQPSANGITLGWIYFLCPHPYFGVFTKVICHLYEFGTLFAIWRCCLQEQSYFSPPYPETRPFPNRTATSHLELSYIAFADGRKQELSSNTHATNQS